MNLVLAFMIFVFLNFGEKYIDANDEKYSSYVKNPKVIVGNVAANSPSKTAGLSSGDEILEFKNNYSSADLKSAESVVNFVKKNNDSDITIVFRKSDGQIVTSTVHAVFGVTPDRKSIGMGVMYAEKIKLPFFDAVKKSFSDTVVNTKDTVISYYDLFKKLFTGNNVLSSLSGPVGIAKAVSGASKNSIDYFLYFVAMLSINLAVFNALPLPALDGGRILFVIYEAITRRKINMNFQYYSNLIGFLFLLGLMLTVTFFDIFK
jgi:regulator of sigma E protease